MDIPFEKVSVMEAKVALDEQDAAIPSAPQMDWSAQRQENQAVELQINKDVMAWLATLPPEVRPRALAVKYPRIFNKIAELWPRPVHCERYLDGLVMDQRGTRQGFPQDVAVELTALKTYFLSIAKTQHFDVWGQRIGE